jgi:D-serine deaminase-like pyridoxal phosphate-dependent protein
MSELADRLLANRPLHAIELDRPVALADVPTPALLIDESALTRNIARMAEFLRGHGKGFRPHAKTHKSPQIAALQLEAGAVGICAAKVSEAIVLARAGIGPVLITSPITTRDKADLVANLVAGGARIQIVVDSALGAQVLDAAARATGTTIDVLIDLDPRLGRTGVRERDDAVRLADSIAERRQSGGALRLLGVQHYAGQVMHIAGHAVRRDKSLKCWQSAVATCNALRDAGHSLSIVTGCGTGTYDIDCEVADITDMQVGSYVFMDQQYIDVGGRAGPRLDDFEVSLTVATTAISQPVRGMITVDCGFKGFASESIPPSALDLPGATYRFAGDEHGMVQLADGAQEPLLGQRVTFVTPHCDPTVNLYDYYWVHRDGYVHALWPVSARGCSW